MRSFEFGFLRTGKAAPANPDEAAKLQDDHLANWFAADGIMKSK
jgi:hypothetical protein